MSAFGTLACQVEFANYHAYPTLSLDIINLISYSENESILLYL